MNTPAMLWTGRILTGLFALFMLGASIAPKLLGLPIAEETMAQLGWPPGYAFMIGIIELGCLVLYLIPRTSVFGAVLMMGLLGGAIATQIRAGSPLFSHVLFSVYLGSVHVGRAVAARSAAEGAVSGAAPREVEYTLAGFEMRRAAPQKARASAMMQHGNDMHAFIAQDVERDVGKPPQKGAPGIAVNRSVAKRLLGDTLKGTFNRIEEIVPEAGPLRFVPTVCIRDVRFCLLPNDQVRGHGLRVMRSRTSAQGAPVDGSASSASSRRSTFIALPVRQRQRRCVGVDRVPKVFDQLQALGDRKRAQLVRVEVPVHVVRIARFACAAI